MAVVDIKTEITGNVWKIVAAVGQRIGEDEPILILEFDEDGDPGVRPGARHGEGDSREAKATSPPKAPWWRGSRCERSSQLHDFVIAGLVPAISIQVARPYLLCRDGRDKRGHDDLPQ